jgi:hypothetical protein
LAVLDLKYRVALDQQTAVVFRLDAGHRKLKANAVARFYRCQEPDLVQAIVEDGRCINWSKPQVHAQGGNQRQAQEAVGNGAAGGTLLARAICVNVDPLVISRACRELVDHGLVDGDPAGSAEVLTYEIPERRECDLCHR